MGEVSVPPARSAGRRIGGTRAAPTKQTYSGGCQCGAVRYEVSADLGEVMSCNCSRCGKLGWLLSFVPAADFRRISGDGGARDYQFNKHVIHHLFCSTCGIQSFAKGREPDGSEMVAINARCLDGVDAAALKAKAIDGCSRQCR
jgi:hypothetical protein